MGLRRAEYQMRDRKSRRTDVAYPVDQENRAQEAERHKQEQLKDQKDGKGKWSDELASNSESIVCALSISISRSLAPPFLSRKKVTSSGIAANGFA
jgi:hypothetical protein